MKNVKNILGTGLLILAFGSTYGGELNTMSPEAETTTTKVVTEKTNSPANVVKIALLLDTSNSMDGLINQAKAQLWDIVNKFTTAKCGNQQRPNLQIALYQYGNDDLSSREGYIQQVIGFSSDLDEISEKLFSLTTNGGEEYCGQVIHTSLGQLEWGKNKNHLKMIFIAGNEPFTQGKLDYRDAVVNAKEKDIVVNTIFCGNYEQGIKTHWKSGAILTGGEYMAIDHNKRVVHVATPYDEIIIKLNSRLNKTYISYGALGASKMRNQAAQDANAMELEEVVAVKRAVSKSSRLYKNSSWDLVDASDDSEFDVAKIDKDQLPTEFKGKSDSEIEHLIQLKKSERSTIQKEIQEANAKREKFIAQQQKQTRGELENAMLKAIQRQAAKKNYHWDQ
ncbi:vWA domain-containing protein [Muriicola sp. Z0-33]|uniref:vWA domain-containing protein n=1 Tax=Muriicola sp. Z0-33 TaxID=2816957 RepID=UPI0022385A82|nr:VWA domain-containing protein [Muriicola sp. Z0-33]MCW5516210.1 VWA domain-containing protein [Muriicola sp. Z0-33]